ncbi:uncharacterized protein LOC120179215 [Hibiscus syriacus]|uniref:uncharacterized protein LOC120179215 n=1 Tax=Hibiscus syriacus TaxID=106335 RepID=UPI00192298BE|nr:uncharacterized protein LOC120179215 [Hibiscus syriacus]
MCPLRLILIFLSATLAGFLLIRNVKSQPQSTYDGDLRTTDINHNSPSAFSKVRQGIESGFWTCVDMASGRYLWRRLVSSNSKRST